MCVWDRVWFSIKTKTIRKSNVSPNLHHTFNTAAISGAVVPELFTVETATVLLMHKGSRMQAKE